VLDKPCLTHGTSNDLKTNPEVAALLSWRLLPKCYDFSRRLSWRVSHLEAAFVSVAIAACKIARPRLVMRKSSLTPRIKRNATSSEIIDAPTVECLGS
jgi:hypothetical protein